MEDTVGFPAKFFNTLFKRAWQRGLELEVRAIHRAGDRPVVRRFYPSLASLKSGQPELIKLNRRKYHIYFGVVPRDPKADHKPVEPTLLTCLWADIDVGPDKPNKTLDEALQRVRSASLKPTIVVKSGRGLHVYYCLKKPVSLAPSRAKKLLRALARLTGADLQSAEVARLLRAPNTINWKDEER